MAEESQEIETDRPVRDNSVERDYWELKGHYPRRTNPEPVPETLYHTTYLEPRRSFSIIRGGLKPGYKIELPPNKYKDKERGAVFFGTDPRLEQGSAVVIVRPDPLDPNWISTNIPGEQKKERGPYGDVWIHVGPIPPQQIVEIRHPTLGTILGKGSQKI